MAFSASFLRSCSLLVSRQIPVDSAPLLFSTTHGFAARIAAASSTPKTSKTGKSKSTASTGGTKKKQSTTTAAKTKATLKEPLKIKRPLTALNYYMKDHLSKRAEGTKVTDNFTAATEAFRRLKPTEREKYEMLAAKDQDRHAKEKGIKVKRPLTAYNMYVKENMPHRPQDKKVTEYMSVLAEEFRNLSTNDRAKYEQASRADYDRARIAKDSLPKKDEPPKRPLNAYNFYVQEAMHNRPEETPARDYLKELGAQWQAMTKTSKKKYQDYAAQEKAAYDDAHGTQDKTKTKAASASTASH